MVQVDEAPGGSRTGRLLSRFPAARLALADPQQISGALVAEHPDHEFGSALREVSGAGNHPGD
jgi:hypothetical protein